MGSLSLYFGCAVVEEHGFAVQARGTGFNLEAGHPNCVGPRKKPYHTVMPVMVTDAHSHDWLCTLGTMAGLPQPAILAQVLLNMMELGLDPQQALGRPRFLVGSAFHTHPDGPLTVESDFPEEVLQSLSLRGYTTRDRYANELSHEAGNANVLARAARWWMRGQATASRSPSADAIWCGAEPRIGATALGY
ncbi:glutathione hydrolase-like YwrD proenzyme [Amblyomma americanum]